MRKQLSHTCLVFRLVALFQIKEWMPERVNNCVFHENVTIMCLQIAFTDGHDRNYD